MRQQATLKKSGFLIFPENVGQRFYKQYNIFYIGTCKSAFLLSIQYKRNCNMSDILKKVFEEVGQNQKANTEYESSRQTQKRYSFPVLNTAKRKAENERHKSKFNAFLFRLYEYLIKSRKNKNNMIQ